MILAGSRILGRALAKAVQEEYAASKNAARARAGINQSSSKPEPISSVSGISLEEAKRILNVSDIQNTEEVNRRFDHLFNVNDKKNGGSLYLQSKIFRAKERIYEELQAKLSSETPPSSSSSQETQQP